MVEAIRKSHETPNLNDFILGILKRAAEKKSQLRADEKSQLARKDRDHGYYEEGRKRIRHNLDIFYQRIRALGKNIRQCTNHQELIDAINALPQPEGALPLLAVGDIFQIRSKGSIEVHRIEQISLDGTSPKIFRLLEDNIHFTIGTNAWDWPNQDFNFGSQFLPGVYLSKKIPE